MTHTMRSAPDSACRPEEQSGGTPTQLKILSYNLYWWNLFGIQHGAGGIAGPQHQRASIAYHSMLLLS